MKINIEQIWYVGLKSAYGRNLIRTVLHAIHARRAIIFLAAMDTLCLNARMEPVKKSVTMPPWLWKQIEARLDYYPALTFVDWARRVFQKELSEHPKPLPDWTGGEVQKKRGE